MVEQIDTSEAWKVMDAAVAASLNPEEQSHQEFVEWAQRVRKFSELCARTNLKTYIAVLGTVMLAKATNPRIDVYSLKAEDKSPGAYNARTPAEHVLVPASQEHGFSLGTTGPQPLNNSTFFRVYRIEPDMKVARRARPVLGELLRLLHEINQYRREEATRALAAFIHVRREYLPKYSVPEGTMSVSSGDQLALAITTFVSRRSDGGGRAQGVVGGLMDALYTRERVRVGKKNEPDRKMPGDVGIRSISDGAEQWIRVFEVRDKNVPPHSARAFITKVADAGVGRAVLVAVAHDQESLELAELQKHAKSTGVDFDLFIGWRELVRFVMFAAESREMATVESSVAAIRRRLIELELPEETVSEWDQATLQSDSAAAAEEACES